ncbi:MAG: MarR family transcriptional regulator [Candidatus Dactylopiibacterium sp.]|nr:MarR family transcriptional regulator [Candidatus Dactylopiibacterium sp.]
MKALAHLSRHERFGRGLVLLARLYRRALDDALRPYGLSEATALPIRHLARLGDGTRQGELASLMQVEGPTLVRALDQLVAAGWVERVEVRDDRRARVVRLTPAGHALNRELDGVLGARRATLMQDFAETDLDAVLRVFAQLETRLGDGEAGT